MNEYKREESDKKTIGYQQLRFRKTTVYKKEDDSFVENTLYKVNRDL